MQHTMGPLSHCASALPSLTKVHAAPSQGAKNDDAETAASFDLRGLAQAFSEVPPGQLASALRSMLQPVLTTPLQEQVAGSVKPLTKLMSKSALGMPNHSTKLASISVEADEMENAASLIPIFPTHPAFAANVAVAPAAIVPG